VYQIDRITQIKSGHKAKRLICLANLFQTGSHKGYYVNFDNISTSPSNAIGDAAKWFLIEQPSKAKPGLARPGRELRRLSSALVDGWGGVCLAVGKAPGSHQEAGGAVSPSPSTPAYFSLKAHFSPHFS